MAIKSYRLSPAAQADLERIWFYTFDTWSQAQADRYQNSLVAEMETLASGISKGRPAARPGVLKRSSGSHVIYYRDLPDRLVVIRILHSAQDVERHLHD